MKDIDILLRIKSLFGEDVLDSFDYVLREEEETFTCVFIKAKCDNEEEVYEGLILLLNWLIKSNNMQEYRLSRKFCEERNSDGVSTKHQEYTIYFN